MRNKRIETAAEAAAIIRAALPKEQKEERVFVIIIGGAEGFVSLAESGMQ